MAKTVTVTFVLISHPEGYELHLEIERLKAEPSEHWSGNTHPVGIPVIALVLHMPRARGQPRRGAAWYATNSRRKRQKKFKKELALTYACRTRKPGRSRTPPMAYVDEFVPGWIWCFFESPYPTHSIP